jgi:hypothetical protein
VLGLLCLAPLSAMLQLYRGGPIMLLGRRRRDGTVVGFTTTCVISACHQQGCEVESHSSRGVPDTILCDKVCQ